VDYSAGQPLNIFAFASDGTTRPVNVTIRNNEIYDVRGGISPLCVTGTLTITDNDFHQIYEDAIKISAAPSGVTAYAVITGNHIFQMYANDPDSHVDMIQFVGSTGCGSVVATVSDNILVQPYQADFRVNQGIFSENFPAGTYVQLTAENNLYVGNNAHGISITQAQSCVIRNNTVVRYDAGVGASSSWTPAIIIGGTTGKYTTSGTHVLENNVGEAVGAAGTPTTSNNILVSRSGGATTPFGYANAFDGIAGSFRPATLAEAVTMFQPKSGGPLDDGGAVVGFTGP
jgi:parallel beta-helix repeat protein